MKYVQEQKDAGDLGKIQASEIVTPKKLGTIVTILKLVSISSKQVWEGDIS
jgi:hypothetical protein